MDVADLSLVCVGCFSRPARCQAAGVRKPCLWMQGTVMLQGNAPFLDICLSIDKCTVVQRWIIITSGRLSVGCDINCLLHLCLAMCIARIVRLSVTFCRSQLSERNLIPVSDSFSVIYAHRRSIYCLIFVRQSEIPCVPELYTHPPPLSCCISLQRYARTIVSIGYIFSDTWFRYIPSIYICGLASTLQRTVV